MRTVVSAIHVAKGRRLPMRSVPSVEAEAGAGLVGDRYHGSKHRHVTIQSAAALAEAADRLGGPVEGRGTPPPSNRPAGGLAPPPRPCRLARSSSVTAWRSRLGRRPAMGRVAGPEAPYIPHDGHETASTVACAANREMKRFVVYHKGSSGAEETTGESRLSCVRSPGSCRLA